MDINMHRMRTGPQSTKSKGVHQANRVSDITIIEVIKSACITIYGWVFAAMPAIR